MLIKCWNKELIKDRETTFATIAFAAGSNVSVTTKNNSNFANTDYCVLGKFGEENTELVQINAVVAGATVVQFATVNFPHPVDTPIYRVDYNRVEFSRQATAGGGRTVLTTIAIQPDDEFTRYEDSANTTGFASVRFNNSATATFSDYSAAVSYDGHTAKSLWRIRQKVRQLLNEGKQGEQNIRIDDETLDRAINDKQRDVGHDRLWPFYEDVRSASTIANQFEYTLDSSVSKIHAVSVDSEPLAVVENERWELLHFDTNRTGDPTHAHKWGDELRLYPTPASGATSTTINQVGGITATDTSVTVTSSSGFRNTPFFRFIIDDEVIYATTSTATTFTGLLRAREGTIAATHANSATITERDIVMHIHLEPTELVEITDETLIPEPLALAYGTSADLALGLLRNQNLHDRLEAKYQFYLNSLRSKYGKKFSQSFGIVRDFEDAVYDTGALRNPNNYPTDIVSA